MMIQEYSLEKSDSSISTMESLQNSNKSQKKSVLLILRKSKLIDQPIEVQSKVILPSNADNERNPVYIECPVCRQKAQTIISYQKGYFTYLFSALLFVFCLPAIFIPFLKQDCHDVIQYCSFCAVQVGRANYRPFQKYVN